MSASQLRVEKERFWIRIVMADSQLGVKKERIRIEREQFWIKIIMAEFRLRVKREQFWIGIGAVLCCSKEQIR